MRFGDLRIIFPWTRGHRGGLPWLALSAVIIALDQASKLLIIDRFELFERITVLPILDIIRLHNRGAAFSFLAGAGGWQVGFLLLLGLAITAVLVGWLRKLPEDGQHWLAAALALIIGGALGNVIDRAVHGHVVDFIYFHFQDWYFPAFNLADSAISVGAALLIWDSYQEWRRERREGRSAGD
jgi:signal peptidase II